VFARLTIAFAGAAAPEYTVEDRLKPLDRTRTWLTQNSWSLPLLSAAWTLMAEPINGMISDDGGHAHCANARVGGVQSGSTEWAARIDHADRTGNGAQWRP